MSRQSNLLRRGRRGAAGRAGCINAAGDQQGGRLVRLTDDSCLVVETKGIQDEEVVHKDQRARRWCKDAASLSGRDWAYEKVRQNVFDARETASRG